MRRFVLIAAAIATAVTGVGVALGKRSQQNGQAVTPVIGSFEVVRTKADAKICLGADGVYRNAVDTFEGTFTGTDPRLNGHYIGHIHNIFNTNTGWGTDTTDARVFDPDTGRVKLTYKAMAVISPGGAADGFADGTASADAGLPPGNFRANFSVQFEIRGDQFILHGELGSGNTGFKNSRNTAIIVADGPCTPLNDGPH